MLTRVLTVKNRGLLTLTILAYVTWCIAMSFEASNAIKAILVITRPISRSHEITVYTKVPGTKQTFSKRKPAPALTSIKPSATTTPTISSTLSVLSTEYIVKPGDTLSGIAALYNVSAAYIANQNSIANVDFIEVGQKLTINPTDAATPINTSEGKYIVIKLSTQQLFAYQNGVLIKTIVVSTGKPSTPTPITPPGKYYHVYIKLEKAHMVGPGYDTPDVPWTMYFYQGYAIHGAYWHNMFGTPVSHGCVNLRVVNGPDDAKWMYDWTPLYTPVSVIP